MRDYKQDLVDRVIKLYNMYERYIWIHEDVKLNILIQDNAIRFRVIANSNELYDQNLKMRINEENTSRTGG